MPLIDVDGAAKILVAGLQPVVEDAIAKATSELVPALGIQFQAAIQTAIAGAGVDSQAAISTLSIKMDKLIPDFEAAGQRLVDHGFDRLTQLLAGVVLAPKGKS